MNADIETLKEEQDAIIFKINSLLSQIENIKDQIKHGEDDVAWYDKKIGNLKKQEDEDAKMLQEEQNLNEQLEKAKTKKTALGEEAAKLYKRYVEAINTKNALYNEYAEVLQKYDKAIQISIAFDKQYAEAKRNVFACDIEVHSLEAKLEDIHKKWIETHPAPVVEKQEAKKPDFRAAFNEIFATYMTEPGIGYCKEYKQKMWKRFDNLVHGRCKSCEMFGYDWKIGDVVVLLTEHNMDTLAKEISKFYAACTIA